MSSPPPTKKGVGRPTKIYTSDQVRDMIARLSQNGRFLQQV